jgi:hypothetical protein
MNKTIDAVYERGVLRPVEPLELQEGESVKVVVMRDGPTESTPTPQWDPVAAREAMDRIAALPPEGIDDGAPVAREHDRYLYGDLSKFVKGREE